MSDKFPHFNDCKCGAKAADLPLKRDHPWYVNNKEYDNCFWTYLRHNSGPHTLNEVADLLNLSISAITSIERKAIDKMKRRIKRLEDV